MSEGRLSPFNESLAEICDTESRPVGVRDLEVDNGVNLDVDVVPGNNRLAANRRYLNFDIHSLQAFRAYVDLNETRVHGLVELSETSNKTHRALLDIAERIGARAAWDGTAQSNAVAKNLQHRTINTMGNLACSKILGI
jgi:hypothetical protein